MQITRNVSEDTWWKTAKDCEYATFFHSPLWHQLVIRTYPQYRDATVGAELKNGVNIVLPLLDTGRSVRGLFQNKESTFAGCYGGIVADGPVSQTKQVQFYQAALDWHVERACIVGNPYFKAQAIPSQFTTRDSFTHILKLSKDFNILFSKFHKGHKSSTKKGRRLGVVTRLAQTVEDYQTYFKIYEDSLERWGENTTSRYPWSLFKNGYKLSQEQPNHIKLWLAEIENKIIAGAWVFYWNHHVVYWHGSAYQEYFDYCPVNVLLADVIKNSCEQGYKYFDFNPSGKLESVAGFKRRFGAEMHSFQILDFSGRVSQVVKSNIQRVQRLRSLAKNN